MRVIDSQLSAHSERSSSSQKPALGGFTIDFKCYSLKYELTRNWYMLTLFHLNLLYQMISEAQQI